MTRKILMIGGILLSTGYGLLSYAIVASSAPPEPADSIYASVCSFTPDASTGVASEQYAACCVDYNEAMDAVERDWLNSLQSLIDQEKPASEMVEDGYESLRTYNCWLEYICRAVEFSGHAPMEAGYGTGLRSEHLGQVPGCQKPEDMKLETEWDSFMNTMKEVPLAGAVVDAVEDPDALYVNDKINMFPRCMTDKTNNNLNPVLTSANENYNRCKAALEARFACDSDDPDFLCNDQSNAFVQLETTLKKTNADQKSRILENKLSSILNQMAFMEANVNYLSNFIQQFNSRFACYAGKCT